MKYRIYLFAATALFGNAAARAADTQTGIPASVESNVVPEAVTIEGAQATNSARSYTTARHSTANVQVVSGQELRRTGQTNVMAALEQLVPSVSSPPFSGRGANGFVRTMQLRNLSADQTLILVNGKRRHRSANFNINTGANYATEPADLGLIPMSAIDHVEVITEGATALYGQDAIAGAVNIVLKHTPGVGSFSLQDSGYYAGDGVAIDGSADYAFKVGHDGGFVDVFAQITHSQPANRSGPYTGTLYFPLANGATDPRAAILGRNINRAAGTGRSMQETAGMNSIIPITDKIEFYNTSTYGHRDVTTPQFVRTATNDGTIRAMYPDGFQPQMSLQENDFQVDTGFRGTLAKAWNWDSFVTFGRDDERTGTLNSDSPTFGLASQQNFYTGSAINTELDAGGKLSRAFAVPFLKSPFNVEVGGDYRHETFQLTPGDYQSWANGGVAILDGPNAGKLTSAGAAAHAGTSPDNASTSARDIFEGHANIDFHILPQWEWTLGGRVANYSDMHTTVETGSIATRYNFNKRWAIRASINSGYRPPTLGEKNYYVTLNSPTYASDQLPPNSAAAHALGSGDLKGESSRSYSIGIDATPIDNLHVTANLYRIAIGDRITNSTKFGGAAVESILSSVGISGVQYAQYLTNPVDTVTYGGDITADYTIDLGRYGVLHPTLSLNFADTEISRFRSTPSQLASRGLPYFDNMAQNILLHSAPKNRESVGLVWNYRKFTLSVQEERYGSVTFVDAPSLASQYWTKVKPGYITNLEVGYDVMSKWHVAVGANNLFNYYPNKTPVQQQAVWSGAVIYPYNSPYGFFGGYYYVKSSLSF